MLHLGKVITSAEWATTIKGQILERLLCKNGRQIRNHSEKKKTVKNAQTAIYKRILLVCLPNKTFAKTFFKDLTINRIIKIEGRLLSCMTYSDFVRVYCLVL